MRFWLKGPDEAFHVAEASVGHIHQPEDIDSRLELAQVANSWFGQVWLSPNSQSGTPM